MHCSERPYEFDIVALECRMDGAIGGGLLQVQPEQGVKVGAWVRSSAARRAEIEKMMLGCVKRFMEVQGSVSADLQNG